MKTSCHGLIGALLFMFSVGSTLEAQEPMADIKSAILQGYGRATLEGLRLFKGESASSEPFIWTVFTMDPHRTGELIKLQVERAQGQKAWTVKSLGAGDLLTRMPPAKLDLSRVKVGPVEALRTAQQGAALAKVSFARVAYQLAAQPQTGLPEWALFLVDSAGAEVGFIVLSAETGAVTHQDFSMKPVRGAKGTPGSSDSSDGGQRGEEAAKAVKEGMRKAWDWTERAGRETKGFFKELFR